MRSMFDPEENLYCNTLWQCTISVIRYGLIGDLFEVIDSVTTQIGSVPYPSSDTVLSYFEVSLEKDS